MLEVLHGFRAANALERREVVELRLAAAREQHSDASARARRGEPAPHSLPSPRRRAGAASGTWEIASRLGPKLGTPP